MPSSTESPQLRFEQNGKVTVVRFCQAQILEPTDVETVTSQLTRLVDRSNHHNILLDFGAVQRLTIDLLGSLMTLHQKAQAVGGRLALCRIHDDVFPIFETLGLPKLLNIYAEEKAALRSF